MIGQEAHYALSVKYGKEGKPVPQYDWADPTDYGEEGGTHGTVADGTTGLTRSPFYFYARSLILQIRSTRREEDAASQLFPEYDGFAPR